MMTKDNSSTKLLVRKIVIIPLVFALTVFLVYSQGDLAKDNLIDSEKDSSLTILEKNKSVPSTFTNSDKFVTSEKKSWHAILGKYGFNPSKFNNSNKLMFSATSITSDNGIKTLTNVVFILKRGKDKFCILKSSQAYFNVNKERIWCDEGSIETYSMESTTTKPIEIFNKGFDIQIGEGYDTWIMDKNTGQIKSVKEPPVHNRVDG